ncbi:MAG: dihydroorotase [Saprospiraceae bacterium]|nr:dihydroorotase [Saprospiraceae bacterium]
MSKRTILLKNANIVNRGKTMNADILIQDSKIEKIDANISYQGNVQEIGLDGLVVIPGIIDDQVHFREPGLTHKANIATESRAAIMGGVTTFMEMPNTNPPATTQPLLEAKFRIASKTSYCNYSFFMGASNDNLEEVLKTDPKSVCGVKVFMGSSTGNMLVDNFTTLEKIFSSSGMLIATHCEDEQTIKNNIDRAKTKFGPELKAEHHPFIRNEEACYLSSSKAVALANKFNTRLHVLHISTADEIPLFSNSIPLAEKRITSEVCVHHLHFSSEDYKIKGNLIKCNPSIKNQTHRNALWNALLNDTFDVVATDHAPHTWEEKAQPYINAPAGLPLVQHGLNIMLNYYHEGKISLEKIVEKMCHNPAICFRIGDRGFAEEGMFADLVVLDPNKKWIIDKSNIAYKCGWSPLEGMECKGEVSYTFVNGELVYKNGEEPIQGKGLRLRFKVN